MLNEGCFGRTRAKAVSAENKAEIKSTSCINKVHAVVLTDCIEFYTIQSTKAEELIRIKSEKSLIF